VLILQEFIFEGAVSGATTKSTGWHYEWYVHWDDFNGDKYYGSSYLVREIQVPRAFSI
jgi:hypothetical protein